jgi:hypothetical protein
VLIALPTATSPLKVPSVAQTRIVLSDDPDASKSLPREMTVFTTSVCPVQTATSFTASGSITRTLLSEDPTPTSPPDSCVRKLTFFSWPRYLDHTSLCFFAVPRQTSHLFKVLPNVPVNRLPSERKVSAETPFWSPVIALSQSLRPQ